ncbi:hypothetical protein [Sandaracinus amylolyticus]|uniref:Uncharacterized protein n=1 Tax=Sandaracinus amylolyticus TaxID=927083 RepID=A0A0F6W223_9BACT|nr:hypothetical protein [Sandaracinus amylolyticus]AKF05315.1 hypothetical protein DB32_002464 [Sandaracinus amylolyticus]
MRAYAGAAIVASVLAGCYADHGLERGPDASLPRDAAMRRDATLAIDAGPSDAGALCGASTARVTVVREPLGTHPCEGQVLRGSMSAPPEAAPEIDGVRLALDLCPDADADCRCVLHVGGVGADLASVSLLDRGPFEAHVGASSIVLVATHQGGEAGAYYELALYAHDGALEGPSFAVDGVTWSAEPSCDELADDGCRVVGYTGQVTVDARAAGWDHGEGGTVRLSEGETASVPGSFATARLLRANHTICGPASPPDAAFVLWWTFPPAP